MKYKNFINLTIQASPINKKTYLKIEWLNNKHL